MLPPVLLPDGDHDWPLYEGPDSLRPGPRGSMEPCGGCAGRFPPCSRARTWCWCPALAVDQSGLVAGPGRRPARPRAGPGRRVQVPTVALLYDPELVPVVPAGPHDQRVRMVSRASTAGVTRLQRRNDQAAAGMSYHLAVVDAEC